MTGQVTCPSHNLISKSIDISSLVNFKLFFLLWHEKDNTFKTHQIKYMYSFTDMFVKSLATITLHNKHIGNDLLMDL